MGRTTDKLKEAHFFLQRVKRYRKQPTLDYYLSAFISSARSVLWVMRSEYQDVEGWESWYASRKLPMDEEEFLKQINAVRVRSEKQSPLKTSLIVALEPRDEQSRPEFEQAMKMLRGKRVEITLASEDDAMIGATSDNEDTGFRARIGKSFHELQDFPRVDVVEICKRYYTMLERVVMECEKLFSMSS